MSAFLGGVAQGFLQAKIRSEDAAAQAEKDRLARLEAQKDRQLRLDIADKQIEMQRQTLLNQQKSANERRDIQIATPAYQEVLATIGSNPQGASAANYPPPVNAALQKYFGLTVNKDGFYTSPTRYNEAQRLRVVKANEELQPILMQGKVDAENLPKGAIQMYMRRSGKYNENQINDDETVRKVSKAITKKYYDGINLLNLQELRKASGKIGGEIWYPSAINKNILVYDRLPDLNDYNKQPLSFLRDLTPQTANQLARDPKNDNAFRHGRLGIMERHLRSIMTSNGIDSQAYKKHSKAVREIIKTDFLTAANIAKNNNSDSVVFRPNSKTTILRDINIKEAYPTLYQVMRSKDNVPSSVNKTKTLTMNEVNKRVSKAIDKSPEYVNNLQLNGKVAVEKVSVKDLLKRSGNVLDTQKEPEPEHLIVPNKADPDAMQITVTDDDASIPSEPMIIEETLKDIIQYPNGSEVVHVGTSTPASFKIHEKLFNKLMSLEGLGNLKEEYLRQQGLTNQYAMLNPVFKTRDAYINNPHSEKTFNDFKNAVNSAFNLTDPDKGVVDPRNLDFAMTKIVERQVKKEETGGYSSEILTNPNGTLSLRKIRNTAEDEKLARRYRQELMGANDKLNKTENDVAEYEKNVQLIGLIEQFEKGSLNMKGDEAKILLQGLREMPGLIGNNAANNALRQGMTIGTNATQSITSFIQTIRDYGVAFSTVFSNLTDFVPKRGQLVGNLGVSSLSLQADQNAKRGHDYANNHITASRLRDVESIIPKAAEQYQKTANKLIEQAQGATLEESIRLKMGAFRNYLLAKNLMTKVTLTYNYAGMVQGESGGRAISNEDFAILYRAIWGTSGADFALGSFKRLQQTIDYLKQRNENGLKYAEFKNGQAIANRMQKFNGLLRRQSLLYGPDAKAAESFSLRRIFEGRPQQSANIGNAINKAYYPASILTKVKQGNNRLDYTKQLNPESQNKIKVRFFRDVAKDVFNALPAKKFARGKTNELVRPINYNRLKTSEKSAVLNAGKEALVKLIYENGTFYEEPFNNLNKYGTSNIRLGNAISNMYKFRTKIQNHNYTTDQQNFINSLIKDLYDNQPPKRGK